jgi:hypothetical protein
MASSALMVLARRFLQVAGLDSLGAEVSGSLGWHCMTYQVVSEVAGRRQLIMFYFSSRSGSLL